MDTEPIGPWWRHHWMEAIYASEDLKSLEVLVAAIYADRAADKRTVFLTLDRLMERSKIKSRDTANRALKGLVEQGFLVAVEQKPRRPTVYALVIPGDPASTAPVPATSTAPVLGHESASTAPDIGSTAPDIGSTAPVLQPSITTSSTSSLSSEQDLVARALGLAESDDRLALVPKLLEDNRVRNPKAWLRTLIKSGDLLERLEAAKSEKPSSSDEDFWGRVQQRKRDLCPECKSVIWDHGAGCSVACPECHRDPYRHDIDCSQYEANASTDDRNCIHGCGPFVRWATAGPKCLVCAKHQTTDTRKEAS